MVNVIPAFTVELMNLHYVLCFAGDLAKYGNAIPTHALYNKNSSRLSLKTFSLSLNNETRAKKVTDLLQFYIVTH